MSARAHHSLLLAPTGDPLKAYVVALLRFDGAHGSTSFPDETGRVWTPSNVTVDTSVVLVDGGAAKFNGPSSPSDLATSKAGLALGSNAWCIEATIRLASLPSSGRIAAIISTGNLATNYYSLRWFIDENGRVGVYLSSNGTVTTDIFSSNGTIAANTTYRICIERVGNAITVYVNGSIVASGTFSASILVTSDTPNAYLGRAIDRSGTSSEQGRLYGLLDEFRWTIGVHRYGGAYTPISGPFPY